MTWRAAWADVSNRHLERAGREERIDHRSNVARGLDEIPTIHEGVAAQALECKGIISDRCEINRQIKADNALLWELKAEIKKLAALVARTVPAIAERLETQEQKYSAELRYSFFYSGDNDYRNSVVSFCNTALLLISDFFSTPLANQKKARYNMTK